MATSSNNVAGSSAPGGVGTIRYQASEVQLNAPVPSEKVTDHKIKRLSFAFRWLILAIPSLGLLLLLGLSTIALFRGMMSLSLFFMAMAASCICVLGILFLFVRYAVVPRLRDIGCYGPFIWIVVALALVFPISGVVWFLLAITPSNFIPSTQR